MATKKAKRVRAAAAGARSVKVKKNVTAEQIEQPTPEQARRVEYERRELRDEMGRRLATTYRRRPLFETMATRDPQIFSPTELAGLRYYRLAHERCDRSATKSCLNIGPGGSTGRDAFAEIAHATNSIIDARSLAQRGDIVMHGGLLGICLGGVMVAVGREDEREGLVLFGRADWVEPRAWRVEYEV